MEFNWEEFISSNNIAVHCSTEEQAIDFCKQMHEHGLEWRGGQSYLKITNWKDEKENTCYEADGTFANLKYYGACDYTILEWSNYEKKNSMNLELTNLTDEQKQQIIELAKKFEQENEADKLDHENDYRVQSADGKIEKTKANTLPYATDLFKLGLTAHTKEEAEKIRRRLLVEKELRDWAKKCKEPVKLDGGQIKYFVEYNTREGRVYANSFAGYVSTNIPFTEKEIAKQAIESIGQERLIRDYFGIDN